MRGIGVWSVVLLVTATLGLAWPLSGSMVLASPATHSAGWSGSAPGSPASAPPSGLGAERHARVVGTVSTGLHRRVYAQTGVEVGLTFHACPPGVFASEASPEACPSTEDLGAFQIFVLGSSGNRRTLDDAGGGRGQVSWGNLPSGDYLLNALALPPGVARFFVPNLEGINAPPERGYTAGPNEGYLIRIGPEATVAEFDVFLIPAPRPEAATTDVAVDVFACPPGVEAAPVMDNLGCAPIAPPPGLELTVEGDPLLDPAAAPVATPSAEGGWVWSDLPEGDYLLRAELPPGVDGYAIRANGSVRASVLAGGSGYLVGVDPAPAGEPAALAVYLLEDGPA